MESARIIAEVTAGIVPNSVMSEHTRRYVITGTEWQKALDENKVGSLLSEFNGKMLGYASFLMLQPDGLNWVKTDWIYL